MESWRQELYHSLSHSVEGSEWKDHKYIAIVDGKYIYPEDVKNGSKSAASTSTSNASASAGVTSTTTTSKVTPPTTPKKVKKQKDKNDKDIDVTDKGSVASYKDLPTNAQVGDMYLLEDTKRYCYWDGEKWTPVDESQIPAATAPVAAPSAVGGGIGGGSKKDKEKDSNKSSNISEDTLKKAREAVKNLAKKKKEEAKASKSTKKVIDTHQKSWDERKAAGKLPTSGKVQTSGKRSTDSALRSLVNKAVSALSRSNISSGAKVVSRYRGVQR